MVDLQSQAEVGRGVFEEVEREARARSDPAPQAPEPGVEVRALGPGGAPERPRRDQAGEAGEGDGRNGGGGAEPEPDGPASRGNQRGAAGGG